jgi:hypothetical protein
MSTRASSTAAGLAPIQTDSFNDGEDSDDDRSEADDDLTSQGTDDTQVVNELKLHGMALFDHTACLVELSQKVKGHAIRCGHPRAQCIRRKHTILQTVAGLRG